MNEINLSVLHAGHLVVKGDIPRGLQTLLGYHFYVIHKTIIIFYKLGQRQSQTPFSIAFWVQKHVEFKQFWVQKKVELFQLDLP